MSARATRGRVILYVPHFLPPGHPGGTFAHVPPLSHLALGGPLRQAGFEVRILDSRWELDAHSEIEATIGAAVCLGITCLTGYPVTDGLAVAGLAKRIRPDVPVIWGGWHPSFVSRQAVLDPRVDVVVRGQGERTFVEVLNALTEKRSFEAIPGITYRDGSRTIETPDRVSEDINNFPPPAYDLIDLRRYVQSGPKSARQFSTIFSRGCPYQCDFCLDSRQKWFGLSLERMRDELEFLVGRFGVRHLRLLDGNFFMGRERLEQFGRMILAGPLAGRLEWTATAVAKRVVQLDGEVWSLLRRAGCSQVAIGAESGSDELLEQITNKTTVEHTVEAVRRLTHHGINQYLFFIVGFPEEPADALRATLDLVCRLKAINPRLQLQMSFCIPLPGSQMFRVAVERGLFSEPRQFADWGPFDYNQPNLPHISADYERTVRRFLAYLPLAYPAQSLGIARLLDSRAGRVIWDPVRRVARWRLEHRKFRVPIEITAVDALHRIREKLAALA